MPDQREIFGVAFLKKGKQLFADNTKVRVILDSNASYLGL